MLDQDAVKEEQPGGKNQWLNSLSLDGHYVQTLLSTLQRTSHREELTTVSAPTQKLPHFQTREGFFSTQPREWSIFKKQEICKSITTTDPPAPLKRTTFQQQEQSKKKTGLRVPLTTLETGLTREKTGAHGTKPFRKSMTNQYQAVVPVACQI